MPSDRNPSLILPVVGAVVLSLAGYVGAYYAMVMPAGRADDSVEEWYPTWDTILESIYYREHNGWHRFFFPINWLDRRIRPHVREPGIPPDTPPAGWQMKHIVRPAA